MTNGLCVLYAKREVKPFGFLAVMGLHLIDVHNMYVGGFMHLMHAFVAHPCMRNDGCVLCVTVKSPLSRLTPRV